MNLKHQVDAISKNTAEINRLAGEIESLDRDEGNARPASDPVNSPPHYCQGGIDCIDAIEAMDIGIEFCQGNAVKYLWRLGHKDAALTDARKAQWYINKLVELL